MKRRRSSQVSANIKVSSRGQEESCRSQGCWFLKVLLHQGQMMIYCERLKRKGGKGVLQNSGAVVTLYIQAFPAFCSGAILGDWSGLNQSASEGSGRSASNRQLHRSATGVHLQYHPTMHRFTTPFCRRETESQWRAPACVGKTRRAFYAVRSGKDSRRWPEVPERGCFFDLPFGFLGAH